MKATPNISDAEWEVMRVLWDAPGPITAGDVVALSANNDQSPRTVKTYLSRLIKKNAIDFEARGKVYWYFPKVSRDACVKSETRSFLTRVFGGDSSAMLVHFVKTARLSQNQIEELKRLLNGKDKSGK